MNPDLISAIANVGAALGTVGAFVVGGLLLTREIGRDQRREIDARRDQAGRVHAWVEHVNAVVPEEAKLKVWVMFRRGPQREAGSGEWTFTSDMISPLSHTTRAEVLNTETAQCLVLKLVNRSGGLIFDVFFEQPAFFASLHAVPQERQVIANRDLPNHMPTAVAVYKPLLVMGDSAEHYYAVWLDTTGLVPINGPVAITFTDSYGRRWHRTRNGALHELQINENPTWVRDARHIIGV